MAKQCHHLDQIREVTPSANGCEECLKMGDTWVHLRICLECGHVGCCDDSKNTHATKHFHVTSHPIMQSFQKDGGMAKLGQGGPGARPQGVRGILPTVGSQIVTRVPPTHATRGSSDHLPAAHSM